MGELMSHCSIASSPSFNLFRFILDYAVQEPFLVSERGSIVLQNTKHRTDGMISSHFEVTFLH